MKARRAVGIEVPSWWLTHARTAADRYGVAAKLAVDLAKAIDRPAPWDQSAVWRFLTGERTTLEMAEAFTRLLGVPRLVYQARTIEEAFALQAVSARFDDSSSRTQSGPHAISAKTAQRLEAVDEALSDQTRVISSKDAKAERSGSSGRPGRTSRGRSTPVRS